MYVVVLQDGVNQGPSKIGILLPTVQSCKSIQGTEHNLSTDLIELEGVTSSTSDSVAFIIAAVFFAFDFSPFLVAAAVALALALGCLWRFGFTVVGILLLSLLSSSDDSWFLLRAIVEGLDKLYRIT